MTWMPVNYADHRHAVPVGIDPVDHAVRAPPGAASVLEWRTNLLADGVRSRSRQGDDGAETRPASVSS